MFVKLVIGKHVVYSGKKFDPVMNSSAYKADTVVTSPIGSIKFKVTLSAKQVEFLVVTGRGRQGQMCFTTGVSKYSWSAYVVCV